MESKKEKYKRKLKELAGSGRFIPGIYNYCDRWCERCTLSNRCLNYAHEQEMNEGENDPEVNDMNNEKFWEQIRLAWEVTLEMIQEDAERLGIDLNNLPEVEKQEHKESQVEELAKEYGLAMHKWLKNNREFLTGKAEQLLVINNSEAEALKFTDAWEVVQWYHFFISAKVHRAHLDLNERLEDNEYGLIDDNLGSAKIALIAIDRSIEALSALYPLLTDFEDDILKFLASLTRIKKMMLQTFPTAMQFKRPGFDDEKI